MTLPGTSGRLFRAAALAVTALLAVMLTNSGAAATPPSGEVLPAGSATVVPDSYVVVLKDSSSLRQQGVDVTARSLTGRYGGRVGHVFRTALHGFEVSLSEAAAKRLAADGAVQYVQRNGVLRASVSEIQISPPSWGLDRIDQGMQPLDGSYTYPNTASNVHAYIIDTGIRLTHTDFGGRATAGFDAVTRRHGCRLQRPRHACRGHGRGLLLRRREGCPAGRRACARLEGNGTTAQVAAGIDWVTAHAIKPAVANMSLGGGADPTIDNAVNNAISSGVTFSVSAGNGDAQGNPLECLRLLPGEGTGGDHGRRHGPHRQTGIVLELRNLPRPLRTRRQHHIGLEHQRHGKEHHQRYLDGGATRHRRHRAPGVGPPELDTAADPRLSRRGREHCRAQPGPRLPQHAGLRRERRRPTTSRSATPPRAVR